MARVIKCTNHCSKCGRHFHSASAFYAHRRGKYRPNNGERGRHCVAPEDAAAPDGGDLFTPLTERGVCDIYGGRRTGVTIWMLAFAYKRKEEWESSDAESTREERQQRATTDTPPLPTPYKRRHRRKLADVR